MRVFVTGATGFLGSAVVGDLIRAGHEVIGLARSARAAEALSAVGADVQRGAVDDLASLHDGATAADGVVHTAFDHDFDRYRRPRRTTVGRCRRWARRWPGRVVRSSPPR